MARKYRTPEEAFAARTERRGDCLIWTGSRTSDGYGKIKVNGYAETVTRWVWEREHGPIPEGMRVDHRYRCDTSCVELAHLRLATPSQNGSNLDGPTKRSSTGVRNVYRRGDRYRVIVMKDGRLNTFGTYNTIAEAAKVAEEKRIELFGKYAGQG